ncbi:MAG: hypothetical protein N2738_03045, partial [Thermodesulfovibrionales bacterium]|nr:hypothetical protein [Thermodesulfovibrionales bacterium]
MFKIFFRCLILLFLIVPSLCLAADITYTLTNTKGNFNELLGVNAGPTPSGESTIDLTSSYQDIGVRLIRTHDYYGPLDLSVMYPDRTKSPSLQSSYNFSTATTNSYSSDYAFSAIINGGFEPYFRIGDSWNNSTPPRNATERNNIATASVNILKHYRQGLWNGFNSNFRFVEIWNEPNHQQFWPAPYTEDDFFLFYEAIANGVKSSFPELKIGGPGFAPSGFLTNDGKRMVRRFIDYVKTRNLTLDFLSYHVYTDNPNDYTTAYNFYRQELDSKGFTNVDLHVTEYNAETDTNRVDAKGAAINTGAWIVMQGQGIKVATFYRGNDTSLNLPTFYGMFFADGRPKKTALAFKLWSQIYSLGKMLNHSSTTTT